MQAFNKCFDFAFYGCVCMCIMIFFYYVTAVIILLDLHLENLTPVNEPESESMPAVSS